MTADLWGQLDVAANDCYGLLADTDELRRNRVRDYAALDAALTAATDLAYRLECLRPALREAMLALMPNLIAYTPEQGVTVESPDA